VFTPIRTSTPARPPTRDRKRGADRPLGVVLVRDGAPKTAITASPMNFSTVPPRAARVAAQLSLDTAVLGGDVLWVHLLGARCEADQVGEEGRSRPSAHGGLLATRRV
jgi:hypothetical protein